MIYELYATLSGGVSKVFSTGGATAGVQLAATNGPGTVTNLGSIAGIDLFVLADSGGDRLYGSGGGVARLLSTTPISGTTSVSLMASVGVLELYSTLSGGVSKVFSTNGFTAGVQLAATNGSGVQSVNNLGSINGHDLFVLADSGGDRLYGSNGTAATTHLLSTTPINGTTSVSLMGSGGPSQFYSTLSGGVSKVFSTDGATAGVQVAATIGPGTANNLGSINGYDLFALADSSGYRLYGSGGTVATTHLLSSTPINGTTSVSLLGVVSIPGVVGSTRELYSTLSGGVSTVFSTNGANPGVQLAATNGPGTVNKLGSIDGYDLFLLADSSGDRLYGSEGTAGTTHLLSTTPINGTTSVSLMGFVSIPGVLGSARELYSTLSGGVSKVFSTDGATAGVQLVATNGPGTVTNLGSIAVPGIGGPDLFVLADSSGDRLYGSAGTAARLLSTTPISGTTSVSLMASVGALELYSTLSGGVSTVFSTNGANPGVQLAVTNGPGTANNLGSIDGYDLFVLADSGGDRLYGSEGTAATTHLLSTTPINGSTSVSLLASFGGGELYSTLSGGVSKVFITNGATAGVKLAATIGPGTANNLGSINGIDLFVLADSSGDRLYGTGGTAATTDLLSTTPISGTTSVSLLGAVTIPGVVGSTRELYSTLSGGVSTVFSTNGANPGVQLAATNGPGTVNKLGSIDGYDLFLLADSSGDRLYGSEGTAATTHLLSTTPINGTTSVSLLGSAGSIGPLLTGAESGVVSGTDFSSTSPTTPITLSASSASLAQAMATFGASDKGISQAHSVFVHASSPSLISLPRA